MGDPSYRLAAVDLNGQLRGKRLPYDQAGKTKRLPLSALNVDIFGCDIDGSPLVFASGDQDGALVPAARGPVPMPWLERPGFLELASLYTDNGEGFAGDPRHALDWVLNRYLQRGWAVTAACELEFYLDAPTPFGPDMLSLRAMDHHENLFNAVEAGAEAMGLGGLTITSEAGQGQFEVTMTHGPAAKIADDVLLLKELIKGTAATYGLTASFMAKPKAEDAGNGLHTHFSVTDEAGNAVFDDAMMLENAVAGCLHAMQAQSLIFAPYPNSYARFTDNAHAPTRANWGYENRTVAVRVPGGARRIEHRVAGGDTCPHLMFAAIFGAAFDGISQRAQPPSPVTGNGYETPSDLPGIAPDMATALDLFQKADHSAYFHPDLCANLAATKGQELTKIHAWTDREQSDILGPIV